MSPISSALAAFRSGEGLKGQLLRGGVGSVAVKIGSTLLNVLLAIVLARALGVEGFGVYSFVFALITIMAIPAQMGLPNLVVRETAKAQAAGDWALMKGLWRWSTLMALMMSAALMATGALAAWLFASRLPEGGLAVFYWGLVLVPLIALGNLRGAALRGLRHVVQGQLPEFILRPSFFILLVLAMHFGLSARTLAASDAMMLHAIASLVAFAIGAWLLRRARPKCLREQRATQTHPRFWLASALPLGVMEGMHMINGSIGAVVVGLALPVEEVGFLRVAFQASILVSFGVLAANVVVAPHMSLLLLSNDVRRLQLLVRRAAQACVLIAIPVAVFLIAFGDIFLSLLFGPSFAPAHKLIIVLIFGQLINVITGPAGILLQMAKDEKYILLSVFYSVVLHLFLMTALFPVLGVTGAALSFAVAQGALSINLFLRALNLLQISCAPFELKRLRNLFSGP